MSAPLILRKINGVVLANFLYEMDFKVGGVYKPRGQNFGQF